MSQGILSLPESTSVSWTSNKAEENEADFLTLRLLNKRARIRLSERSFDLGQLDGQGNHFAIANTKGWFAAIALNKSGEYQIICSPLGELRQSITSSKSEGEEQFTPKRVLTFENVPTHIAFASNEERMVVVVAGGHMIVYDTSTLFSAGSNTIEALHIFRAASPCTIYQVLANPADLKDLVAVRRSANYDGNDLAVEVFDMKQLQSIAGWSVTAAKNAPTSIAWSSKGKQLAIGVSSGDIVTYSPTDTAPHKLHVPRPPSAGGLCLIHLLWLSNQAFFGIYAPFGTTDPEASQKHILTTFDSKSNSASQTEFDPPYYPSPGLRPPGPFTVVMRNWEPTKVLAFVGDSTSSDIGVVGNLSKDDREEWCSFSLEETSTPGVPLDRDSEDTVPMALQMDLTIPSEGQDPGSPILYVYASDGTLQSWFLSNSKGGPYPGMVKASVAAVSTPSAPVSTFGSTPGPSAVNPTFGAASLGAPNAFGQSSPLAFAGSGSTTQPAFSSSTFGKPAFGQSGFGQSTFGQSASASPFSTSTSSQSPFNSSSGGFGAFSGPSKFGQSAFAQPQIDKKAAEPEARVENNLTSPEAEMADDSGAGGGFGGLSLGISTTAKPSQEGATNKMFGSFGQPSTQPPTSSFGAVSSPSGSFGTFGSASGISFLKPATGFGAFSNKPAESKQEAANLPETPKPSHAFGSSSFGSPTPQPAFGQTAFGQSSFGQSSFDKPSFGAVASPAATPPAVSAGGFSSFGGTPKGFAAFASNGSSAFSQQASSIETKPSEAPSITMASSTDTIAPKSAMSEDRNDSPFTTFSNKGLSTPTPFGKATSSVFGSTTPSSSPFASTAQGGNAFGGKDALKASVDGKPAAVFDTPRRGSSSSSSPETSPVIGAKSKIEALAPESPSNSAKDLQATLSAQSTTPFGTPAPSVFAQNSTAASGGAFANLKTTHSAFGPSEGFGAFGKPSSSSPFANTNTANASSAFTTPGKPISAFGTSGFGAASTTPTFGTPSTPGGSSLFGKSSSFGTPNTPTPTSTTPSGTPVPNAFSAFTGNSGGFSAFATSEKSKSFSDLLKQGESKDSKVELKDEKEQQKGEETKAKSGLSAESSFVTVPKPEELEQDLPPTPSTHGTFDQDEQDIEDESKEDEHDDAESFLSETFSGSEGKEPPEDGEVEEEEEEESDDDESDDDEEDEDEEDEGEDEGSEEGGNEREDVSSSKERTPQPEPKPKDQGSKRPSPAASTLPLPAESVPRKSSKSPPPSIFGKPFGGSSSIPTLFGRPISAAEKQAEASKGSPSSDKSSEKQVESKLPTPSASPLSTPLAQQSPRLESKPLPAPTPVVPSSSPGFGLGRPSSRPTKSSPLASPAISSETSQTAPVSIPVVQKPRPASPKTFGQLPVAPVKSNSPLAPPNVPSSLAQSGQEKPSIFGSSLTSQPTPSSSITFGTNKVTSMGPTQAPSSSVKMPPPQTTINSMSSAQKSAPSTFAAGVASGAQQAPSVQTSFESSMQRELQNLYVEMHRDLENLGRMTQGATTMLSKFGKPARSSHTREDLTDRKLWAFGDLQDYAQILKQIEKSVILANKLKDQFVPLMHEIETNQLKAETLKEEITRFSKAKADPEFAQILRERTLGPDAAETQSHLRKQIRLINDRLEQLEGHLGSCKKKIEERRRGKASLKPPSLDTINRTYRNIDMAIESQTQQIEELTRRVSKFNIETLDAALHHGTPSKLRHRQHPVLEEDESASTACLRGKDPLQRSQVTPSIAASTAAALNAERNALRLKNALAKARKEPLLNTRASKPAHQTPTIESLTNSPPLPSVHGSDMMSNASLSSSVYSHDGRGSLDRRASRQSRHTNSVKLGKTHTRVPSSISNFDWGPLPGAAPMTTLPVNIRPETSPRESPRLS